MKVLFGKEFLVRKNKDSLKKVELELSDYALVLYEQVPKELRAKAIEAGLMMLASDNILCQTFFDKARESINKDINAVTSKSQVKFPF